MNRILLSIATFLTTSLVFGQVIFSVEQPMSLTGSYDLTYAPATTWGSPDMLNPMNAIVDTLAFAKDATAADSLNCMTTVSDVAGKIAVLYRGGCEFGTKALNAQTAGAIGVVIINNQSGGPIGMGPGAQGLNVTIPVVMIGDMDGVTITEAMKAGVVEVFIGNKTGFYPNDIGMADGRVLSARQYSTPLALAQNDTEFSSKVGAWVYNYGSNDQTTVNVNATVNTGGAEVYNQTGTAQNISAGDSAFFVLPDFSQTTYSAGKFDLTYTLSSDSTSVEDYAFDNTRTESFILNDSIFSYARLNETTYTPIAGGGSRPSEGSDFTACIAMKNDNASRVGAKGITFSAVTGATSGVSLEGEVIQIQGFQWNDVFTDLNDPNITVSNYDDISVGEYVYGGDYQDSAIYVPFEKPFILADDQRYMFCIYTSNPDLFFGYDSGMDYTTNVEEGYLEPAFPNFNSVDWFINGFGNGSVPAISMTVFPEAELGLVDDELNINITAYPNPSRDAFYIQLNDNASTAYTLVDLTGKTVATSSIEGLTSAKVNVSNIENGAYILKIQLANGNVKTINMIVNH